MIAHTNRFEIKPHSRMMSSSQVSSTAIDWKAESAHNLLIVLMELDRRHGSIDVHVSGKLEQRKIVQCILKCISRQTGVHGTTHVCTNPNPAASSVSSLESFQLQLEHLISFRFFRPK